MILTRLFRKHNSRQKYLRKYLVSHWGVSPRDIVWYEKALRHKSVIGTGKFCHIDCNERLELLGDAVLDTVITEYLFHRFPEDDEGVLTKIRSRIVNRQMLGKVGMNAGLNDVLEARIGSDDSLDKIVGNALEAWLGAIYVDRGFEAAKRSIEQYLIARYIDIEEVISQSNDFKSKLIEWVQHQKSRIQFNTQAAGNEEQWFTCEIYIDGKHQASGSERSKKRAEQQAAQRVCETLGI